MITSKENQRSATRAVNKPSTTGLDVATASLREENELLIGILETLSQSRHMDEYLEQLVGHLKKYSGCCCVGIRLLDDEGNIPYISYDGFSMEFYLNESPLSLNCDKCMCINVINGATDPSLPFYTDGGSFLSNSTTEFLASTPEDTKGQTRNVCNQYGYESVALVPMKHRGTILGLIHLADEGENKIPEDRVRFLEQVGAYIGEALHTFRSEEALRMSEVELLAIYENSPIIMILVDEERRVRKANQATIESTGRQHDEILGLRGGDALRCIHAVDDPAGCGFGINCENCIVRNSVLDTLRTGKTYHRVEAHIQIDRGQGVVDLHILLSTSLLDVAGKNLVLVCMEDITEHKRSEQALQVSEERYALAQRAANIGSWDWDILTGDLQWSDRIEPLFGFARGKFGATYDAFLDCVHPEDRQYVEDSVNAAVEKSEDYDIEHRIIWPDRTVRWVREIGAVVRDESGKAVRMLGIVQDITERKKLDQLKDEFIGMVSHELRSPLTVVIGAVNTALTEAERLSTEETRQLLQDAASEAESLSHLLGNLLELSRVQADRLLLYVEPVSVETTIQSAVERIKQRSPTRQLVIDLPKRLPLIPADQLKVERILYNLLENAVKYSPQESAIRIFAKPESGHLVIGVSDQGIGISPQDQAKLFGAFQRLEDSRLHGVKGTGLGLLVCRRLVEAHGGQIWVESAPGQGATFFFTLPLRKPTT